jgi:hypothetical protein
MFYSLGFLLNSLEAFLGHQKELVGCQDLASVILQLKGHHQYCLEQTIRIGVLKLLPSFAPTFFSIFFKANPADFTTVKKGIKVLSWLR